MVYCTNLPPELRYRVENVLAVGITPAPKAPTATTLPHLMDSIITPMLEYGLPLGVPTPTYRHPEETNVRARLAPVIGDSPARAEVTGFLQHKANFPCSWCLVTQKQLGHLDRKPLRNGAVVREQAANWRAAVKLSDKKTFEQLNGVRWSSLHMLPYYDPVWHVVLGVMHNWHEGVIEDHLRRFWGIGRTKEDEAKSKAKTTKAKVKTDSESGWSTSASVTSVSETSASELDEREVEGSYVLRRASTTPRPEDQNTPKSKARTLNDDSKHEEEEDEPPHQLNLSRDHVNDIRDAITEVTLPTWMDRPPENLGEASHGSLKARDYLTLFSTILPLVVPEFWYTRFATDIDRLQLHNFHHLVVATNIVSAFTTSNAQADKFTASYLTYRQTLNQLYPQWKSKPNHHWAMHNGDILKMWGPLASSNEYFGERLIGILQQIKTNQHMSELFFSMSLRSHLT